MILIVYYFINQLIMKVTFNRFYVNHHIISQQNTILSTLYQYKHQSQNINHITPSLQQILIQMQESPIIKLISPARPLLHRNRSPLHSIYSNQFQNFSNNQQTYHQDQKLNADINLTQQYSNLNTYLVYDRNVTEIWDLEINKKLKNKQKKANYQQIQSDTLEFDSNFESGNLKSAFKVRTQDSYNIFIQNDINTYGYTQWFFFKVTKGICNKTYKFNIVNFYKKKSLYQSGMKIMIYTKKQNEISRKGWHRGGQNISYFENGTYEIKSKTKKKYFYTLSFTYTFKYNNDEVMFAYNYPYTYTQLNNYLDKLEKIYPQILRRALVTRTLAGNKLQVLTITNFKTQSSSNQQKKGIIITGRVHSGQTVSSYIVKGIIDYLISNNKNAFYLRQNFIFKIIPMVNPDGVIHGNYRTNLAGSDLNRKWENPDKNLHPEIFYLKRMILEFTKTTNTVMFCDMHGHSKKKNAFVYGCFDKEHPFSTKQFPFLISKFTNLFSFNDCSFGFKEDKKGTARVVLWKSLKIPNIYTMETSFCGPTFIDIHFNQKHFEQIGKRFCETLLIHFQNHIEYNKKFELDENQEFKNRKQGIKMKRHKTLEELYNNPQYKNNPKEYSAESDSSPESDQFDEKIFEKIKRGQFVEKRKIKEIKRENKTENSNLLSLKVFRKVVKQKDKLKKSTSKSNSKSQSNQKIMFHNIFKTKSSVKSMQNHSLFRYRNIKRPQSINQSHNTKIINQRYRGIFHQNIPCTFIQPKIFSIVQPIKRGKSKINMDTILMKTPPLKNYLISYKKPSFKYMSNSNIYTGRQSLKINHTLQQQKFLSELRQSQQTTRKRLYTQVQKQKVINFQYSNQRNGKIRTEM